jgi:hypothetical protein
METQTMERLSERHKQALRFLVKGIREGSIPEEFNVFWNAPPVIVTDGVNSIPAPLLSELTLDLLADEGLMFSRSNVEERDGSFDTAFGLGRSDIRYRAERYRECYITPDGFRAVDSDFAPITDISVRNAPVAISDSLGSFRKDFPDNTRTAFVMMQFGVSSAHHGILEGIQRALSPHNMVALRADSKGYHSDLFYNILTYIYGCRFGIAVFDRIERDSINPNVSLEVGYMLGLGKSVCFLKDRTLTTLQTDLVGKLYRTFDPHDPQSTIPRELLAWLGDNGFIVRH